MSDRRQQAFERGHMDARQAPAFRVVRQELREKELERENARDIRQAMKPRDGGGTC